MSFEAQSKKAIAISQNRKWSQNQPAYKNAYAFKSNAASSGDRVSGSKWLAALADDAYSSKEGYAIKVNPYTGEKEMFVRGTTFKNGGYEWFQNAVEAFPRMGYSQAPGLRFAATDSFRRRKAFADKAAAAARREGVSVVYGHSRGGAVIHDMNVPGASKVGLDAATVLVDGKTSFTNYRQGQWFDKFIGPERKGRVKIVGGRKSYNPNPRSKRFHKVWK